MSIIAFVVGMVLIMNELKVIILSLTLLRPGFFCFLCPGEGGGSIRPNTLAANNF